MYIVGDLMKSILVEITCPTCLWHTHKPSDTVVIPEFEPDLKQQLEQEEFYAFTCPRCGTRISFFHTCIYPDKQHHFVLLMKSEKEKKAAHHHLYADMSATKRYISDARDIAEKIHILEEGFDDRVIEILKLKVYIYLKKQQRYPNTLRYKDRDKQSETIWFSYTENDQEDVLALTWESYLQVKQRMPEEDTKKFHEINQRWALQHIKNFT